nr:nitrate regulatory gene2 protein-like [Ipomoea batatas]GMD24954.1 nitrate regulatory gene2 protein-like [Ipomoea batatas]
MGNRELNAIESYGQTQTDEKSSQEHTVKKRRHGVQGVEARQRGYCPVVQGVTPPDEGGGLLSIAEEMPNVFIRTPSSTPTFKTPPLPTRVVRIPSPSPLIHQPPQLHYFVASQQQQPQEHGKNLVKLPHILSESSFPTSPRNHNFFENENYTYDAKANSTYSSTPSQASSVQYCEEIGLI